MKLQKEIVLGGGRNLALFVCLAMLSGAYADDLTPMYGKASGTGGSIQAAITWYSDAAFTSTEGVITPWQTGSNTCRYVIIEASKMQATSAFPDVPVCFGSDSVSKSYNFGCNVTLTFPQLTIYSGTFMANSDHASGTILKGNCSFVKTAKSIKFAPMNVNSKAVRGWNLAGTYESASDVSVQIGMTFSGDGTGTGFFDCSGDFSSFKGRFYMPEKVPDKGDNVGYFEVRLTSPTALGDTSFPRTDAFLLKHRTHITMADNVVQDGTRGITLSLSDGDFACLNAASGKAWTLKAPLYGSTGTLKKVGAGTVTLAGPVEIKDIVVTNGTLVVAPGATFPADGHITVKAGGKLVSRVGTNLPVPYTLEEGGRFAFDFTVPYEDGATTALDCTNMTAEAYALLSKPIEVGLSQTIPLPVNATQELACVRFPSGLVQVADFTNVTAKTAFGLPNAWFKVVSDAEHGEDVLTLVVKPAIDRTGPDVYRPFTTQYTYSRTTSAYTDTPVWSDGLAAHAGADYIHTNGCEFWSWDGYDNNTRTFPGDSLYLTGEFRMKSARVVFPPLTISGGVLTSIAGSPHLHHFAGGPYTLLTDMTLAGAVEKGNFFSYSLDAELLGSGNLTLSAKTNEDAVVYVTSTNRQYTGRVTITNEKTPANIGEGTVVSITDAYSLGGPLPSAVWNGIGLAKYSLIRPQKTMTMDAVNRGIGISSTYGGFDVPTGVVLTVEQRVRLNPNGSCTLLKEGPGTLIIAGEVKHGYAATNLVDGTNNRMRVDEGFIRAVNTNSYSTLRISFAADAGVEVDPESTGDVASYGIYCPRAFEPVEVGGKVLVRPVPTFEIGDAPKFAAVVCTVASSLPDLKATLKPASVEGYTGRIEKDDTTHAGLVTYTAKWFKAGFTVIFR